MLNEYATPTELSAILGDSWGVCRSTPRNRERYARCLTPRQYEAAERKALDARPVIAVATDRLTALLTPEGRRTVDWEEVRGMAAELLRLRGVA